MWFSGDTAPCFTTVPSPANRQEGDSRLCGLSKLEDHLATNADNGNCKLLVGQTKDPTFFCFLLFDFAGIEEHFN